MVNNITNNTITEIDAKKNVNTLNKIKNAEIKYKKFTPKHKELLNLFNGLLDIILTDKTESEIQKDKNKNENKKVESRKEENEKVESRKEENEKLRKNNVDAKTKESIEKLIEIKSLEEDKNMTDWFDKNKFKKILAIIDSNKFNYRNKIGEFKYIDIRDLVNNIRNNTISEIDAKKNLNTLNKIKNVEVKYKKLNPRYKELLNLFNDLLDITLTDKTLESEIQKDKNKNENEKVEKKKVE